MPLARACLLVATLSLLAPLAGAALPAASAPRASDALVATGHAPTYAYSFRGATLPSDWSATGGVVSMTGSAARLTAFDGFSGIRLARPISEGVVSFTWDPRESSAYSYKQLYVDFRGGGYSTCFPPDEFPCDRQHRVIFALDEGVGTGPTGSVTPTGEVRFDSGLYGSGTTEPGLPVAGSVGAHAGVPFRASGPLHVDIVHKAGVVIVELNGEVVGAATFDARQTASVLTIESADDGSGHDISDLRYFEP